MERFSNKITTRPVLDLNIIVYGALLKDTKRDLMVSALIILAKSFIHEAHPSSHAKSHFYIRSQQ